MKKYLINTDGASRGNPGQAAAGIVIQTADGVIWVEEGIYLGKMTNNEAEYQAVILALTKLKNDFAKHLPAEVVIRADSQLVVSQLSGRFKIKNSNLKTLHKEVKSLEAEIGQIEYLYLPREKNFLADKLANLALDKQLSS